MTRETPFTFEVHSPSPSIVIPARRTSSNISTPLTPPKMSPITGSPVLESKLVTLTSSTSPKSSSLNLHYMSSSPATKTGEYFKKSRSYSHAKSTSDILGVNHQIPSLTKNPFSECEIFTTEVSKSLPESNAKKINGTTKPLSEVCNKPNNVLQNDNNENQNTRRDKKIRRRKLGQAMDSMYPPSELDEEEKKSICFSAFPDSNSFDVGDTVFNFRIRCSKSGLVASDFVQGVKSKRKSVIAKDKAILKRLAEAVARGYPPGPQIPFKSKKFPSNATETYLNFYAQFLKCGNFATWLRQRTIEAQNELRKRYLQVLCEGDVKTWMAGKHEMELVDLLVRVKDELKLSTKQDSSPNSQSLVNRECDNISLSIPTPKQREKLKAQADIIISGLPRDLRESFTAEI
ncbi:2255_t:CDS:2 [Racocetra fulgida]|uniref:2255_t:CDS:1 n=1 Tax=Racocetra fulgida TaxID=60492 RepID=A0A9N9AN80_9GLOM|nr:2255_t:CDS:2 [Racocetra fulgida]